MRRRRNRGLTLIELVIVITLCGICAIFMTMFIVKPVDAYTAQAQRAGLVDAADSGLRLLSRDLRSALPNSIRVGSSGSVTAIEMLATLDGARYNDQGPVSNAALWLDFSQADGAFATTVPFSQISLPYSTSSNYLAIYNVGVTGANAYALANVITPAHTAITITAGATANAQLVTLSPSFQFSWGSPNKRVYLVSGPVSYLCDTSAGTLTRYSGYSISATQATSAATLLAAGATAGSVATNVGSCSFVYAPGTYERGGMATLTLALTSGGQNVELVQQVHLVNAP
jgi:MSHA biogenesis protein MshO